MRRLVCVIEGHGERDAAPVLCNRVMRGLLHVNDWYVDEDPVRHPRSLLVDEKGAAPRRPPNLDPRGLPRALALAAARDPAAILVLCDADDDCPVTWGPAVPSTVLAKRGPIPARGVMACREYESWLLWAFPAAEQERAKAVNPESAPRDAKKALEKLVPGYTPPTHQLEQTRRLDLAAVWALSDSFDKFVRSIAVLLQVSPPARPQLAGQPRPSATEPAPFKPPSKHLPRRSAPKPRR
jgi:hypothetical protein